MSKGLVPHGAFFTQLTSSFPKFQITVQECVIILTSADVFFLYLKPINADVNDFKKIQNKSDIS